MAIAFPGESGEYRVARDRLLEQEIELRRAMEAVAVSRRRLPPGGVVPQDYAFHGQGPGGDPSEVRLSARPGPPPSTSISRSPGRRRSSASSPSPGKRGWRHLRLLSSAGTTYGARNRSG
jgi:Bacterial protein of unknown function (DUF899)